MPNYPIKIISKAQKIRLLICDVDGVLSNGKVYYSNQGEALKSFNIKDGLGIKQLLNQGIELAIITGRQSEIVEKRATELGIKHLYQGKSDKQQAYDELLDQLQLKPSQVAYVGDDLPDLPLMKQSGLSFSVQDGYYLLLEQADWVTKSIGGNGAVREITDLLLSAQDKLAAIHQSYNP